MGKDTKSKTQTKPARKNTKTVVPEIEDFFTIFLAKKNRNVEKKIKHITELQDKLKAQEPKTQLTKDQQDLLNRKPELERMIEDNNELKKTYLEAWSKREDEPQTATATEETKPEPVTEVAPVPQIDETEVENRGVRKALSSVSKYLMVASLLRNKESCNKFEELSKLTDLESVLEFNTNTFSASNDNTNKYLEVQELLFNYINQTPVLSSNNKPLNEVYDLVEKVANSETFATFAPFEPEPIVQVQVVEVQVTTPFPPKTQPTEVVDMKDMNKSRKESEAQQDIFMADDDSDNDDDEYVPAPAQVEIVETKTVQVEKQPLQEQEVTQKQTPVKAETRKFAPRANEEDEDGDEWHTASRGGPRTYDATQRGGRGARGGRGSRGGYRGNYRGGRDGERREGDRREGDRREGDEKKTWVKRDGDSNYRGRENNGERGRGSRGGYRGKKPWNKDLERKTYEKTGENVKPQGEGQAPLKEVGTLEQKIVAPVEAPVVAQE